MARILFACALAVLSTPSGAARAQQQVKPYFLIIFDTSGSMGDDVDTGSGPVADSCGFGTQKIDHAKCVLGKILNATGDAEFGLMQFDQDDCTTDGDNRCDPDPASAWLRVPIQRNSVSAITPLIDNADTGPGAELCAGGYTPLGGTLLAARAYYEGDLTGFPPTAGDPALDCRPLSVILMTDGLECCNNCMASWSGCDSEVNDLLTAASAGTCHSGSCTTAGTCSDNHFESAPQHAYELATMAQVPSANGVVSKEINTYVIGFGIAQGDPRIERIAIAGGTDSPDPNNHAFYATDEESLALAFNQIIADAQPPPEVCNNADDDCDTLIDEGIPKFCDKPNGITEPSLCDEPDETLCDGEDDDCDGFIDEGVLNACGVCGDVPDEVCDALDNDCDGTVDEGTSSGEMCGTDEGICESGEIECIGGVEQCIGERGPEEERCDCQDNDCDGFVDEDVNNDLCPGDEVCIGCECRPRCTPGQEFMPFCPRGLTPEVQEDTGECLCIEDTCDPDECADSSLDRDGELACGPDETSVAACFCRAGACIARCDGVSCGDGDVCNKRTGLCTPNNCLGLGCAAGELCEPLTRECVEDPCAEADCEEDEVCRDGECEKSCADVTCDDGEMCRAGRCVENPCADVACGGANICLPDGECGRDPCADVGCEMGQVCSRSSGECELDPCWGVVCPENQNCYSGDCYGDQGRPNDRPPPREGRALDGAARVLATGGGGCACRAAPGPERGPWGACFAFGVVAAALSLRRRRRYVLGLLLLGLALLWLGGCSVDAYCLDCSDDGAVAGPEGGPGPADGGSDGGDDDGGDGGGGRDGGASDAGGDASADTGVPGEGGPACQPVTEACNGRDDDCDFTVDEDVTPPDNDCNQLGACEGTTPLCLGGAFACRYEADDYQEDETRCDDIDNDCDGLVDEAFPSLGDSCQQGRGACLVTGELVCNDTQNGMRCAIADEIAPVQEVCDGIDNDCDGLTDEPKSDPGDEPSFVQDSVVQAAPDLWIYAYEASRPDASDGAQGITAARACSKAGVLPWTNLTYSEAVEACAAADMTLCTEAQWQQACEAGNACAYGYTPSGGACLTSESGYPTDGSACNGHDLQASPGGPDNDALLPTGAMARCFVDAGNGPVYDLSGNAKEWTTRDGVSPAENPLRGGSYNNLPGGMTCGFDFSIAAESVRVRNVGFRCCSTSAP